jgi:hypothetical protein
MAFWRMLKQGYDHFEVTRQEPKIDVCDKRYVFDAETKSKFSPAGACPAYTVNADVMAAVREKQQNDDRQVADLVSRGTNTVPVTTGNDGGMHPTFLAAFQRPYSDSAGVIRSPFVSLPGTIPAHARPPGPRDSDAATGSVVATPDPSRTQSTTRVATAQPAAQPPAQASSSSGGLFGNLFSSSGNSLSRLVGLGGSEPAAEPAPKAKPAAKPTQTAAAKPKTDAKTDTKPGAIPTAQTKPAAAPAAAEPKAEAQQANNTLSGAQPAVPSGSFDTRWGQFR